MKNKIIILFILSIAVFPEVTYACATCFGNPNAAATQGMNKAILSMLGITGGVLGGVGSSIFILHRRAKEYAKSIKENKN
jgi:hypothetical protein|tara:strand:+ start:135 stop:374 length:240 start_codon:yes stop_codon:yes gene_type:complete